MNEKEIINKWTDQGWMVNYCEGCRCWSIHCRECGSNSCGGGNCPSCSADDSVTMRYARKFWDEMDEINNG